MMKNRDMFYSDYQMGAIQNPNMNMMMPNGYMMNSQYQAFGPNAIPNNYTNMYSNEVDDRLTKLEAQIRNLDNRVSKLESGNIQQLNINNDSYMI